MTEAASLSMLVRVDEFEFEGGPRHACQRKSTGKTEAMNIPIETKPALWGAGAGAIAIAVLGFTWGGWVTGGTAEMLAKQSASKAVISALAPICVDNFKRDAEATRQLAELKKVSAWQQAAFVEKGGWAKMPGSLSVESGMATACAEMILALKS